MTSAYPLQWPDHRKRTPAEDRRSSRFNVTPGKARNELMAEIFCAGGEYVVLSTNVELRRHAKAGMANGIKSYCLRRTHNYEDEANDIGSGVIWIGDLLRVVSMELGG
jgi:hypothetical protein